MKKLMVLFLALVVFSISVRADILLEYDGAQHNYTGPICSLIVNGKLVSTPLEPIIFNNRAVVPVREVFEAMGAEVTYINKTQEINITLGETYVSMQIGSDVVTINGNRKSFPDGVKPMLIAKVGENPKTMVPVRFVSENLGMNVVYDSASKRILINNPAISTPEYIPAANIKSISTSEGTDTITVLVNFDSPVSSVSELTFVESSGVLYCDIYNTVYSLADKTEVNKGPVLAIRLGKHEGYSRIAIDTSGAASYNRSLSADRTYLVITVSQSGSANIGQTPATPAPTATPTPVPTPTPAPTPTPEAHLTGEKIVVLDAGHGGSDPGAVYTHDNIEYKEKTINLAVAKKVYDILTANGIRVEMTRSGDTYPTLTERAEFANKLGAAMFVSIHSNSFPNNTNVNGIEVYYAKTNNGNRYGLTSKNLATSAYKNLIKNTSADQRGVKTAEHAVTRRSEMPAILIELGFITNKVEAENLYSDKYRNWLADAIATAIMDNLGNVNIPPLPMPAVTAEETY